MAFGLNGALGSTIDGAEEGAMQTMKSARVRAVYRAYRALIRCFPPSVVWLVAC